MNKFEKYQEMRKDLELKGIGVTDYKEINYGLQFDVELGDMVSKVRIYENKKGLKLDLSLVKFEALKEAILNINNTEMSRQSIISKDEQALSKITECTFKSDIFDNPLIGVDESGKGDYFGPLVVAGVYADSNQKRLLQNLGVMDSKALTDKKIHELAEQIKKACPYEVITINNATYNKLYTRINNLNKLLAWGHARVIENMLGKVDCNLALSDQFGNESFIQNALMEKGRQIKLEQKPRAEENVVVAAASILARDQFVAKMDEMSQKLGINFPKGASATTITVGREFVEKYGRDKLAYISKLHFKTTNNI